MRHRQRLSGKELFPPAAALSPREAALAVIKREALRLGQNGTREGVLFARRLFERLPELREA